MPKRRLTTRVLVVACLGTLTVGGTAYAASPAAKAAPKPSSPQAAPQAAAIPSPVNILGPVNTFVTNDGAHPIPTQVVGTLPIAGGVAATQSGAWNVGITGTPNVAVVDNRVPFQTRLEISAADKVFGGIAVYNVPTGMRLVTQFISVMVALRDGQVPLVSYNASSGAIGGFVPLDRQGLGGGGNVFWLGSEQILDFRGPGELFEVGFSRQDPNNTAAPGPASASVFISGYLVPA